MGLIANASHYQSTIEQLADVPSKRGRPAKHTNVAAKQKAHGERQKAKGLREVKRYIRDLRYDAAPLSSDIIDLGKARHKGRCER